jgi:hypothetical protein
MVVVCLLVIASHPFNFREEKVIRLAIVASLV